jgi:serine/threonine protein kinase
VKVLDFGLAKAIDPAESSAAAMANSPTLTARATQLGMIIGTAAYMAPEQARGRAVDRRADIWAFGVVTYEMLSGRRAFDGDDISITLASVLKEDVRWDALPADLPAPLQRLLRRCLEKDPKRRLGWIGEARLILEDPASLNPDVAMSSPPSWARRRFLSGVERCRGRSPRLDSPRHWSRSPCGRRGAPRLCPRRANCTTASASTPR